MARAQKLTRLRDRARLFQEILGTPRGRLLLEELDAAFKTGSGLPPNQLDDHGRTDALQTWRKLGHFDVLEFIKTTLTWREHVHTGSSST